MASYSIGGIILHGRKQDRRWFVFPDPVVQSSLRGHKDVKKDGDGAAGERPAKRARTYAESLWIGFRDPEKCRWQIPIRTLLIHFWKAQHYWLWHVQKLLKVRIVFGEEHVQSTTYVPEDKEYLANCMKYKFHLKGSSQFPEISQLFWHGIWSALEYGQEIARIMVFFPYKPSSYWGYHHLWKPPGSESSWRLRKSNAKTLRIPANPMIFELLCDNPHIYILYIYIYQLMVGETFSLYGKFKSIIRMYGSMSNCVHVCWTSRKNGVGQYGMET